MGDTGRGVEYEAGLDGLRAVAVVAVVLFHSEFEWARGGFLGVSIFFTLSGFLITRLLLVEHGRTGSIGLRRFWTRRIRRLAPASLLCLAAIAACIPWFAASAQIATVRSDLLAALFYSANWRFVAAQQSYADLFVGGPSPVLHFWSLAIEEQFYIVYPLLIVGVCRAATRLRRSWIVGAALLVLAVASMTAGLFTNDRDLYYYGTHTRAVEFLVGAIGALVWLRSDRLRWFIARRGRRPVVGAALIACAGSAVLLSLTRQSDGWLYRGGFPAISVVWMVIIAGAMTPGVLRTMLSTRPMVLIGRLSFGIYLVHWPIFQLITPARLHTSDWRLHAVRLLTTSAIATVSYLLVERPIRTNGVMLRRLSGAVAFASTIALVALLAQVIPAPAAPATPSMVNAPDAVISFSESSAESPGTVNTDPPAPPPVVVVLGSEPGRLAAPELRSGTAVAYDIVDLAASGCSFLRVDQRPSVAAAVDCDSPAAALADYLRDDGGAATVVLTLGDSDHVAVAERLVAGFVDGVAGVADEHERVVGDLAILRSLHDLVDGAPISIVDYSTATPDPLTQILREVSATYPNVTMVDPAEIAAALDETTRSTVDQQAAETVRVMVVGDSTSFGVAEQLDALAGDRYDVLWAGGRNCPFVAATRVRWWAGVEFEMDSCLDTQQAWPDIAADFRPDIVLVVASLPELSDQQYAGDDGWYAIGDPAFEKQHIAALRRLAAMVEPRGGLVLVSDAPTSDWTDDDRVAAFNTRLTVWLSRLPRAAVLRYGEYVAAAEAEAGRSLRPDNVHLTAEALQEIVRDALLSQIDEAVQSTIAGIPRS